MTDGWWLIFDLFCVLFYFISSLRLCNDQLVLCIFECLLGFLFAFLYFRGTNACHWYIDIDVCGYVYYIIYFSICLWCFRDFSRCTDYKTKYHILKDTVCLFVQQSSVLLFNAVRLLFASHKLFCFVTRIHILLIAHTHSLFFSFSLLRFNSRLVSFHISAWL